MRKNSIVRAASIAICLLLFSAAAIAQQSLGEAARQARKNKPAEPSTRVITNEDIGAPPARSETSTETSSSSTATSTTNPGATAAKPNGPSSADEQAKLDQQWKEKFSAQKDKVALLERELDVLQRENKLRAAALYGDAGNRLRNPQQYAEDDRKYRDQVAAKQKAIDEAKSKLNDMRDEARKAGASPGAIG